MTRYTPAVTIVAAWIRAETGVGPSIAFASHVCSGNCADFPIAPIKSKIAAHVSTESSGGLLANCIKISLYESEPTLV